MNHSNCVFLEKNINGEKVYELTLDKIDVVAVQHQPGKDAFNLKPARKLVTGDSIPRQCTWYYMV